MYFPEVPAPSSKKAANGQKGPAPKYPLHLAIKNPSCSEQAIMQLLQDAFTKNEASIGAPDDTGARPITVAIAAGNVTAVQTLVALATPRMAAGEDPLGLHAPDADGDTPFTQNVRLMQMSPRFVIHDVLDGASRDITKAFMRNKLPACTCGKCSSGWLSPRMRFRLRETAHDVYMAMLPKLDNFQEGRPLDSTSLAEDTPLQFIPAHILAQGIYKPFYVGYRAAFHAVRVALSSAEGVPTIPQLRLELSGGARSGRYDIEAVDYFLERGGSVKHALDMVIHLAACLSCTAHGDGSFDRKWDEMPVAEGKVSPVGSPKPPEALPTVLENDTPPNMRRSRRSSSFSWFGKKERRSLLLGIQAEEDAKERERQRKLKEEWDASGEPGCPLDDQFVGVRYLLGVHTPARWDVDAHDAVCKRQDCQLRRM